MEAQDREKPLILVVDDYEDTRDLTADFLGANGFDALTAACGLDALLVARKVLPDAILLDFGLPDLDGHAVARQLRADPMTRMIKIVLYTASVSDLASPDCDGLVRKPAAQEIIDALTAVLRPN